MRKRLVEKATKVVKIRLFDIFTLNLKLSVNRFILLCMLKQIRMFNLDRRRNRPQRTFKEGYTKIPLKVILYNSELGYFLRDNFILKRYKNFFLVFLKDFYENYDKIHNVTY